MKHLVVLLLLVVLGHGLSENDFKEAFVKWMTERGKMYQSSEFLTRYGIFKKNMKYIEEWNADPEHTSTLGLNDYADLTPAEFRKIFTYPLYSTESENEIKEDAAGNSNKRTLLSSTPPVSALSAVNWVTAGFVAPPRSQGSCDSSSAFAATGAITAAHMIKHNMLFSLSAQQLVDCAGKGCGWGWAHDMFTYLERNGGSCVESEYPYTGRVGACQNLRKVVRISGHKRIAAGSENDLLSAVSITPVTVAINAATQAFMNYKSGILDVPNCGNTPNQALLVVGYGSANGKDYWLLQNSFGTSWGEEGYIRIVRNKNMCGIADWASYPIAV